MNTFEHYIVEKTAEFDKWFRKLKDKKAKARILLRIQRVEEQGNFGDYKQVGEGICELRIHYGKGYRMYIKQYDRMIVLLLIRGDKSTQSEDIAKAKELCKVYQNPNK